MGPDTAYLEIICFTARWRPQTSQVEGHGIERRMDPKCGKNGYK